MYENVKIFSRLTLVVQMMVLEEGLEVLQCDSVNAQIFLSHQSKGLVDFHLGDAGQI